MNTKLTVTQLKKLKIAVKNKTGTTLRSINESSCSFGKNILAPLGITAAASAIDGGIQKKIHGFRKITLTILNEEMNDKLKIVPALEDSNIFLKEVTREQRGGFLGTLVATLGLILLGNLLSGKGIVRAGDGNEWYF